MIKVTLDEIRLNAILAALDDRQDRIRVERRSIARQPRTTSRDFTIDCLVMASNHIDLARAELLAAIPEPELPSDMTFAEAFA